MSPEPRVDFISSNDFIRQHQMTGKILSKTYFSTISTTDNPYMIGLEPNVVLIMPAAQIGDKQAKKYEVIAVLIHHGHPSNAIAMVFMENLQDPTLILYS